jgi:sugar/nucleoside kinase (ribokinase family)
VNAAPRYTLTAFGELAAHVSAPFPVSAPRADNLRMGAVEVTLGGGSVLVCQQLARLGHDVRVYAMAGRDGLGDWVLAELRASGVDLAGAVISGTRTTRTLVLHHPAGSHDIVHEPSDGDPAEFSAAAATLAQADQRFAYVPGFPGFEPVLEGLGRSGVPVVADLGYRPWLDDMRRYCDEVLSRAGLVSVCLLTGDRMNRTDQVSMLRAAAAQGPWLVVMTLGPLGAMTLAGDDVVHVPAVSCRPVNTLGAGDAFASGLIAGLAEGLPVGEAMRLGNAAAAAVISMFPALPSRRDVDLLASRQEAGAPEQSGGREDVGERQAGPLGDID